ncbi:MAG: glycosyl transferase [Comamonadaceae bacterium]|nr:glycosyl transferase [Comamonadaceae bacterium]
MEESNTRCLVVSVVSHGHGEDIQRLMEQLARLSAPYIARVVVTYNLPEPELRTPEEGWPFVVQARYNQKPLGFGTNHNRALADASESFVCVLNPDVELLEGQEPFAALLQTAAQPRVGCAYPLQVDRQGCVQDSERELPSPTALGRRWLLRRSEQQTDWVNAACMVLPLSAWRVVGGFDERYFMYCEDVDLCLRLRLQGLKLSKAAARVIHPGRRSSHRHLRHLIWHLRSLKLLWSSPAYRSIQKKL